MRPVWDPHGGDPRRHAALGAAAADSCRWRWSTGRSTTTGPGPSALDLRGVAGCRGPGDARGDGPRGQPAAPGAAYTVLDRGGEPVTKEVRYWAAEVTGGGGPLANEIDEVRWLDVAAASDQLDYARDRDQLRALVRADNASALANCPSRSCATPRRSPGRSGRTPTTSCAPSTVPASSGHVPSCHCSRHTGSPRVVSLPSVRGCADTVRPYAAWLGRPLGLKEAPSEEGYEADSGAGDPAPAAVARARRPTALCSHGPVLPALLDELATLVDPTSATTAPTPPSCSTRLPSRGWPRERCWWRTSSTAASGPAGTERHLP